MTKYDGIFSGHALYDELITNGYFAFQLIGRMAQSYEFRSQHSRR